MNDQALRKRLGTSSFHKVFLKMNPWNPAPKFQPLEIDYDETLEKNKM